jgi:hypothetical protein
MENHHFQWVKTQNKSPFSIAMSAIPRGYFPYIFPWIFPEIKPEIG